MSQGPTVEASGLSREQLVVAAFWARLLLLTVVYVSLLLVQVLQGQDFLHVEVWQWVNGLMAGAFLLQLGLAHVSSIPEKARQFLKAAFAYDTVMVALLLAVVGSNHSIFLFLLLVFAVLAGLTLGTKWALGMAAMSGVALNLVYALAPDFDPMASVSVAGLSQVALMLTGFLSGSLGEQIQFVTEGLVEREREIEALTDLNELIVDNIPSGILMLDSAFKIRKSNRGSQKLFEDLALDGKELAEVFPGLLDLVVAEGASLVRGHVRAEIRHINYRQERLIIEAIVAPIKRASVGGPKYIVLLQNLTEVRNLEHAMRQKEKLAAVGQLAAGIAHEIRNPLASISGSIQLLGAGLQTVTAEEKKLINITLKEIDRLNNLITEFLDFVRPDVKVDDPISINQVLKDILEMVRLNEKMPKHVAQRTELRATRLVAGQYDKLKQAFLNVAINSYQAMTETLHAELWVQTADEDGFVTVTIQDNGIGMGAETLKRLFEPFHTTKPKGTGLGLAITHKIFESHGAEVSVESERGRGTKFTVRFPIWNENKKGVTT